MTTFGLLPIGNNAAAVMPPDTEGLERALSLAVIGEHRVREQITTVEGAITTTAHAMIEMDAAISAAHARGEDVEPLREQRVALGVKLDGLKRERPGLTALLGQRQAEIHEAERHLYVERRKVVAEEADRLVNRVLLPTVRKVVATVEMLRALDEDDRRLRFRLGHDLGETTFAATPLYGAGLEPSEAWEALKALGGLLDKLQREHPTRRKGTRP